MLESHTLLEECCVLKNQEKETPALSCLKLFVQVMLMHPTLDIAKSLYGNKSTDYANLSLKDQQIEWLYHFDRIVGQSRPVWVFLWSSNSEDNVEKVEADKQRRGEEESYFRGWERKMYYGSPVLW